MPSMPKEISLDIKILPEEGLDSSSIRLLKRALQEIEKRNFSSALTLINKVLRVKSKSKSTLLLKAACMFGVSENEIVPQFCRAFKTFCDKLKNGIFDYDSYKLAKEASEYCCNLLREAMKVLELALEIDPNFSEAKKLKRFIESYYIAIKKEFQKLKKTLLIQLKKLNFAHFHPHEFEKLIAKLFMNMGFSVNLTPYISDFGADIIATRGNDRIVIQVKKYSIGKNVGAKEVREILGAMWKYRANKAIIITTSDFTILAQEQAKNAPIELWNRDILYQLIEIYLL